ncbi:MAG: CoA transferase [Chloroflexi bacterium]|nr:CoA transferase [Chloroflexota bacterium]
MLEHIKVLDLSTLIAGPYCSMLLGESGAKVIKIEPPKFDDPAREMGPPFLKTESSFYLSVNRNKRGMTLDLTKDEGREILFKLVAEADVFVQNYRPDVVHHLGVDYDATRRVKPDIIYCGFSAFGEEGPYRTKAGTDTVFQGMSGVMTVSGEPQDPPVRLGIAVADMAAGLYAAYGVMSALYHRERTGQGQKVAVTLLDSLIAFQTPRVEEYLATGENPPRTGRSSPFATPIYFFETKDSYINISIFSQRFWTKLCKALGVEHLTSDPKYADNTKRTENRDALLRTLGDIFRQQTTDYWRARLDQEDVPNGPIYTYKEMFADPQVKLNQLAVEVQHPTIGPVKLVSSPVKFSATPARLQGPPPLKGQHTNEILNELGYGAEDIERLRREGVV